MAHKKYKGDSARVQQELSYDVSVIVPSYKNVDMLRLCLQSVIQALPKDLRCQVIVSDGATEEQTILLMEEEFPYFTFIPHDTNVGFGALVRDGMNVATGRYFFILNPDTIVPQGTIDELMVFMDQHPQVGVCGPKMKNFDGTPQLSAFRFYKLRTIIFRRLPAFLRRCGPVRRHLAWFAIRDLQFDVPQAIDGWLLGSALFVRKKAIEEIGPLDPRFFMYFEDTDWCRRFLQKGWEVWFVPTVQIYHYYGKGSNRGSALISIFTNRLLRIHIASACKYFWKWGFFR